MRILMVSEDLPGAQLGGLGKQAVSLANVLLRHGHQVDMLGRGTHGEGADADCRGADGEAAGAAAQIGFGGRFIGGFDLRHVGWKERQLGFFNPFKRPWLARKVARAIARLAPHYDVVHYHGHLPMVGLYLDASLNFVQTRHDQGSECIVHLRFRDGQPCALHAPRDCAGCARADPGLFREALSGEAVRRYRSETARAFARHKTIFVSEFLRRQFLRAVPGADLARCRVLHNFIDDGGSGAAAAVAASAAAPVQPGQVLLVGRIDAGKGFRQFLAEACPRLPPWATLAIVGDGPERAALAREFAGPRVCFAGWQDSAAVVRSAARSHLWVVPSVLEESFGMATLEALWLGKPCLALDRGGTPELAAYQRYPGQLQLAPDMPALVGLMLDQLSRAPRQVDLAVPFAAGAALAIPKIVAFYAE